jgi:type IV pilus biogenesis protein CpaD/CtpE
MKRVLKAVGVVAGMSLLAGCASFDHQDVYLLGGANEQNIAAQSVRDVNLPNSREVEASSGVRAVKAVKALNEGKTQELGQASANQTGS